MIQYILFDLDDTLYETSSGMMHEVSQRMSEFMVTHLDIPRHDVDRQRKDYWARHGTTLRGLYIERQIDPQEFLRYVHDIRIEKYLQVDPQLDQMLARLPQRKSVFTNAPGDYAREVLRILGVEKYFDQVYDINFFGYESKPNPQAYDRVVAALPVLTQECLMIDDTARNLVPAKQRGMKTAWLHGTEDRYGIEGSDSADFVLASIYDVEKIVTREAE